MICPVCETEMERTHLYSYVEITLEDNYGHYVKEYHPDLYMCPRCKYWIPCSDYGVVPKGEK